MTISSEFALSDVVELYTTLDGLDIQIWIDGGWGVDALLSEQTRPHQDIDIVIQKKDVAALRTLLEGQGYQDVPEEYTEDWHFVLGDDHGRLVDVHIIEFDEQGNGHYGPTDIYYADALAGRGQIGDLSVRCISPEWMVRFHTGYDLRAVDYHDVRLLCDAFDIPLPDGY